MAHGEDTSRDPRRQVSRLAHVVAMHQQNEDLRRSNNMMQMDDTGGSMYNPESVQYGIDEYRNDRDKLDDDIEIQSDAKLLAASFKNRHNKDYGYEDL